MLPPKDKVAYPLPPELEQALLEKLLSLELLNGGPRVPDQCTVRDFVDAIDGLMRGLAQRGVTTKYGSGNTMSWQRAPSPGSALRRLKRIIASGQLNELAWLKAWRATPTILVEAFKSQGWKFEQSLEVKGHSPVPNPDSLVPFMAAVSSQVEMWRGEDADMRDIVAAEIWLRFVELTGNPIMQPSHSAGSSVRAGKIVTLFELINEVYGPWLPKQTLISGHSGAAWHRVMARISPKEIRRHGSSP